MFAWLWRSIASLLLLSIFLVPDTRANEPDVTCEHFNSWIWAQAVFDSDPEMYAALDPDGNDIACKNLNVNGFGPVSWTDSIPDDVIPVTISRIVDGDTIRVIMPDNTEERVRLLHIDSPELSGSVAQCGATEATDYLTWMLSFATNNTVYLEQDVSERDRYDRLLAYVWFEMENSPQPYMANDAMVMTGWAESKTYEPDVKYKEQLDAAEQFSVEHVTGIRLLCGKFGQPVTDAAPSNEQVRQAWQKQPNQGQLPPFPTSQAEEQDFEFNHQPGDAQTSENCDPAYPTVCIPLFSEVGDLNCGDISHRRFKVLPPDPHNFDGDFNGIGCERD